MKRKTGKRLQAIVLAFMLLVSMFQGIPGLGIDWAEKVEAAELETKMNQFINDSRWRNGNVWGGGQGPKFSTWQSSGCCAYAADFVRYVYGSNTLRGTAYYNISEVRAGDVIQVPGHWFVVLGRNGNSLYTAEGNMDGRVAVRQGRYTISNSKFSYYTKNGLATYTLTAGFHYGSSKPVEHDPEGYLDAVWTAPGQIRVSGWALDRDNVNAAINVHIYIGDNARVGTTAEVHNIVANKYRKDVGDVIGCGYNHAFDVTISTNKIGVQKIYAYGINIDKNGKDCRKNNPQLKNVHTVNIPPKVNYTVNTGGVTNIKNKDAKISGSLTPNGNANSWGFYIGTSEDKMTRCTVSASTTASSNMSAQIAKYYSLKPGTKYYYRTWAWVNEQEKKGSVSSFTTTAVKPDIPIVKPDSGSKNIGIGDAPSISWNAVEQADSYKAYLYDENGEQVQTAENITGTKYAFKAVETSGTYTAMVEAVNEIGSKGMSEPTEIEVHPDVTVKFMDADSFVDVGEDYKPEIISEQKVHWGKAANKPADPSHTGYNLKSGTKVMRM